MRGGDSPAIGLLGDVMLGRGVAEALADVPPEEVWGEGMRELCASLDLVVCNLECCVSSRGEPTERIAGKPFFFRAPPEAVRALAAIGVRAVSLANNHTLDYEADALDRTLQHLSEAGIASAGAGGSLEDARRPAELEAGSRRVAVVCVSDHPREYAAGEPRPGIAHADLSHEIPPWLRDQLGRSRERCDLVIAFPHWGPNMTEEPAPWQRRAAAEMEAAGADLVAGHSAHVFHGVGWRRGPILYDLGDAIDDYRVDRRLRNDLGLLAVWRPGSPSPLELHALKLEYCRTELAHGRDAEWIAARLHQACAPFGTRVERVAEGRFRVAPPR